MDLKRDKRLWKGIFFVFVISILLISLIVYLWISRPLKVETLEIAFSVGNSTGFDLNTSLLTFGRVTPGGSGTRTVFMENSYDFDVLVRSYISKNLKEFIISEKELVIGPGEKIPINVDLKVSQNTLLGNYSGKIKFVFRKT